MSKQLSIFLSDNEEKRLNTMATLACRRPHDQARFLLLSGMGLLQSEPVATNLDYVLLIEKIFTVTDDTGQPSNLVDAGFRIAHSLDNVALQLDRLGFNQGGEPEGAGATEAVAVAIQDGFTHLLQFFQTLLMAGKQEESKD